MKAKSDGIKCCSGLFLRPTTFPSQDILPTWTLLVLNTAIHPQQMLASEGKDTKAGAREMSGG